MDALNMNAAYAGREEKIRAWFGMWLAADDSGIEELFTPDTVYIESWGPEYHGLNEVRHWFAEWNTRGRVLLWDIKGFFHSQERTAVEWYFENSVDGRSECFDGVTIVLWSGERIARLQEFGCSTDRYDPYAEGPEPVFRDSGAKWF